MLDRRLVARALVWAVPALLALPELSSLQKQLHHKSPPRRSFGLASRPPLTGVSWPLRGRNPQRVSERVSRGLPAQGSRKCPKQSRKSLRSLIAVFVETLETLLFWTLFGPWAGKPGRLFQRLDPQPVKFGISWKIATKSHWHQPVSLI